MYEYRACHPTRSNQHLNLNLTNLPEADMVLEDLFTKDEPPSGPQGFSAGLADDLPPCNQVAEADRDLRWVFSPSMSWIRTARASLFDSPNRASAAEAPT